MSAAVLSLTTFFQEREVSGHFLGYDRSRSRITPLEETVRMPGYWIEAGLLLLGMTKLRRVIE
jgi:hypothetical protein